MVVTEELKSLEDIKRAIIKRYRKHIWSKFIKAIKEYDLIQDNDKIAIAISGGKDSLLLAKLFQELQKNGKNNFELEFLAMDPGYHPDIRVLLEENCKYLNIPVTIYDSDIFKVADKISSDYPCYMCARMRRGSLYAKAKELGCNKLALGHHFDDVIETNMLNILCAGNFKTMMPKLKAQNFDDMEIIRPMYLVREESIIRWMTYTGLMPMNCACMVAAKKIGSTRHKIKDLIKQLEDDGFTNVAINIFRSCENVDMDRILGYINEDGKHSFLDNY
ncbi:tRNA 2-thiocytidine biosynthesis TtcA family protein [Mediannikoviicoccus vaginalis]|uniref:tRNA 2-thiocytidine biosynthesis TtcA family protein n=1 Tax=Mediannikoviicoccus vaginalis TaxID=2899727 RepID=UPI001F270872|nr:tRNA 2-thiocytidine biosynthesis TtcA family protein [Mediannikoviicoccus vaginalis]